MLKPFHLSFVVPDVEAAKNFYINILNCKLGRNTGGWIDIIFFGHQITIHQENEFVSAKSIDHFGPVLGKSEWEAVAEKCTLHNIQFVMPPTIKDSGSNNEAGKFLINDPAGNLLEFKFYKDFVATLTG